MHLLQGRHDAQPVGSTRGAPTRARMPASFARRVVASARYACPRRRWRQSMAEPFSPGRVDASGLTSVSRALEALRPSQRVYVVDPDALVPRRVTREQARRMLADVGRRNSAAIVTCRVRGPQPVHLDARMGRRHLDAGRSEGAVAAAADRAERTVEPGGRTCSRSEAFSSSTAPAGSEADRGSVATFSRPDSSVSRAIARRARIPGSERVDSIAGLLISSRRGSDLCDLGRRALLMTDQAPASTCVPHPNVRERQGGGPLRQHQ